MNKKEIEKKVEELKTETGDKEVSKILNQFQQNIHFNNGFSIEHLHKLAINFPDLAKDLVEMEKTKMNHIINVEKEMISLEKSEQPHRQNIEKEKISSVKRGQWFAFSTTIVSFVAAVYFVTSGNISIAVGAMLVGGLIVASNFLGFKSKNQK